MEPNHKMDASEIDWNDDVRLTTVHQACDEELGLYARIEDDEGANEVRWYAECGRVRIDGDADTVASAKRNVVDAWIWLGRWAHPRSTAFARKEISEGLTEQQRWLLIATLEGMRGRSGYFDFAGYGSGVASTARSLRRRGLLRGASHNEPLTGEVWITDKGRKVAKYLRKAGGMSP